MWKMKAWGLGVAFALVASRALLGGHIAQAGAEDRCSNRSWHGSFGFTLRGWRIGGSDPGPRAAAGRLTADGSGNLAGTETRSRSGLILRGTFVGTYSVNPDCTGSATATLSESDGSTEVRHFDFVIVDSGKGIRGVQTDEGRAQILNATRQEM